MATRGSLARVLGLTPDVCAFDIQEGSEKDGRSLFIAASLAEE